MVSPLAAVNAGQLAPVAEAGSVTMHNIIPRLSATPGVMRTQAPKLGEHTAEILARLGVDADELGALRENKIV